MDDHSNNPPGHPPGHSPSDHAGDASFVFHRALHEDSPVADEGGPVSRGSRLPRNHRDDLAAAFPFEDADVLADLFLDGSDTTVARIGPGGLQAPRAAAPIIESKPAAPAKPNAAQAKSLKPAKAAAAKAESAKPEPMVGANAAGTFIESLIVGHLPVLGSAWVMQYAKHRAQTAAKPVVLLRVSGADVSVDVAFPPASLPPNMGPMPSVADAIRHLKSVSDQWIVRIDEAAEGMDAAELMRCLRASDCASVLTGADEAAVVACYRVIKTLGADIPPLHVVVMGSSTDAAGDAAKKLSKAAEKFLGKSVSSESCSAKITPGSTANVYRGRPNLSHDRLIELVRESVATRLPPASAVNGVGALPEPPAPDHQPDPCAAEAPESKETGTFAAPVPDAFPPAAVVPTPIAPPPAPPPVAAPRSAPTAVVSTAAPHAAASTANSEPSPLAPTTSLARHLPSLEPLEARCPYAPEVELAVDPSGRLHLIARSHADATDPNAAFSKLAVARTWALAHAALLERAFRQAKPLAFAPEQHLLTDAPKRVRPLLDTDVRLHLLTAPAGTAETGPGWVCVELN
ncbi:MAG: hypothetical protein K2Y21_02630 [Phycisphaerales bacterium]|nr:hypothetical protein [Phycisphaerales bacterium]